MDLVQTSHSLNMTNIQHVLWVDKEATSIMSLMCCHEMYITHAWTNIDLVSTCGD